MIPTVGLMNTLSRFCNEATEYPAKSRQGRRVLVGDDLHHCRFCNHVLEIVMNWKVSSPEDQDAIRAEQNAGFRSKFGPDEVATGGFSNTNNVSGSTIQGRIEYAKKGKRDVHGNIL